MENKESRLNTFVNSNVAFCFKLSCIFLLLLSVFWGCSLELSSDRFWSGAEEEANYVKRNISISKTEKKATVVAPYENPALAVKKADGKKFKIGVVVSGDYWEFFDNLKALIEGFANIGWARQIEIPASVVTTKQLIEYLAYQGYSDFIEFDVASYVNLEWGDNDAELTKKYFDKEPSVDAIIAYGGMAAKAFYNQDSYSCPVLADAITDVFGAGISVSINDSGKDFFSCKIDPDIYKQQLRLFHTATGLKTLGIIYGADEYGFVYGAVRDVEAVSKELRFKIIRNTNVKEEMADDTVEKYLAALEDVASRADAVYIGASMAVTEYDIMDDIVAILDKYKKPSFSLEGAIRVKDGVLYSLSSSGMTKSGIYMATKLSHVFYGVKARNLPQKFESIPSIAINLETAEKIGYKVPMEILINSDEIYLDRNGTKSSDFWSYSFGIEGFSDFAKSSDSEDVKMSPRVKDDGSKYTIKVVASGTYWEFTEHFKGIIKAFKEKNWINFNATISPTASSIEEIIAGLGNDYSSFIEFLPVINLDWGNKTAEVNKLIANGGDGCDVIIAFGGVAGKTFTNLKTFNTPVLIEAVNDPVGSNISYSKEDSGKDFITCRIDSEQYQRQLKLFHDFIGFNRLGIIYGDNEYGRLYGAVNDVEFVALKKGFKIIRNTNVKEVVAPDTKRLYLDALKALCKDVDAVYIGASTAVTEYDIIDDIVKILNDAKIPSFALEGEIRVKDGVLMSVSSLETEKIGQYNVEKIIEMFANVSPRSLNQVFTGIPSIALNMKTAEKIGLNLPLDMLSSVDKTY